jgi:hypothetical protein
MTIWRLPVTISTGPWGRCNNTWHIRTGNLVTTDAAALQAAANAIRTWYTQCTQLLLGGSQVMCDGAVEEGTGKDQAVTWATYQVGTSVGTAPPVLAVCTSWKTASRTRRGRGRTFLGPLDSRAVQNDGTVDSLQLSNLKGANDALVAASLTDNDWAVCIWGLEDPAPENYTGKYSDLPHIGRDITGHAVQDKFAVMRSRRP